MCHDNQKRYKKDFCMYSNKLFLKYGLQDNHWVGKLLIKPVDDVVFLKRKVIREGDKDQS